MVRAQLAVWQCAMRSAPCAGPQAASLRRSTFRTRALRIARCANRSDPMGARDPRVDAYIAKQADFAKPILSHIRDVVHAACPDVEEDMKWSAPFFMYHGTM